MLDHQVVCHPLYSGAQEVALKFLRDKNNVDVTLVGYSIDEYRAAIRPNTKVKMHYAVLKGADARTTFFVC